MLWTVYSQSKVSQAKKQLHCKFLRKTTLVFSVKFFLKFNFKVKVISNEKLNTERKNQKRNKWRGSLGKQHLWNR